MIIQPRHLSFCLLSGLLLCSCANWAQYDVRPAPGNQYPIAVLPIQVTARIDKLSDIIGEHQPVEDEKAQIKKRMQAVSGKLTDILRQKLAASPDFIITPLENVPANSSKLPLPEPGNDWTHEDFHRLGITQDTQAILRVRLVGYGKLKREWVTFLLGTGVIEGVVQGVVAARLVGNNLVGLAVGLEEIAQEYLTWGGGSYLFNTYYAPVTLQAELISTSHGKKVWDKTVFVSIDRKAVQQLPEEQRTRDRQLELTAIKAINELTESLNSVAQANLPTRED